jgi:hypothetical protein
MPTDIDTATSHADLYDRLLDFLQTAGPTGPGWTMLDFDTAGSALFVAPGMSATEEIHMGVSLHASPSDDTYAIGQWMFRDYNASLPHLAQPGHSGVRYLPLWNTAMPYWFIANAQRCMIAAKVSTSYLASYFGKFLPHGTPGEYPQPYYLAAPVTSPTTRWSTIVESDRNFFDPGVGRAIMSLPSGIWRNVGNYQEQAGEASSSLTNYIWPFGANVASVTSAIRYRELREQLDGDYWTMPLILMGEDPDLDIYGELDGAFAVSGFNNASENTFSIDGVTHVVIQNMHRTARMYYAALALE